MLTTDFFRDIKNLFLGISMETQTGGWTWWKAYFQAEWGAMSHIFHKYVIWFFLIVNKCILMANSDYFPQI